jgi:hypothetical protein
MKVNIEVDIPDGADVNEAIYAVNRHFDPNWISDWWHIDDVKDLVEQWGEEISDEDAREVLRLSKKQYDSSYGINVDVIEHWAEWVLEQQAKVSQFK